MAEAEVKEGAGDSGEFSQRFSGINAQMQKPSAMMENPKLETQMSLRSR